MKRGPGSSWYLHEWLLTSSMDEHNAILFCELRIWKLRSVCEYRCFLNKNPSTSNSGFLKLLPHRILSNLVETAASVMQDGNFNQLKREGVQEPHADFILAMAQRSSTFTPCRFAWGINGGCSICLHLIYGLHELGGIRAPVSRCPGVKVCEKPRLSPKLEANENRACDIICIGWTPHHTRSCLQYSWRSQSAAAMRAADLAAVFPQWCRQMWPECGWDQNQENVKAAVYSP